MNSETQPTDKYDAAKRERDRHVQEILVSSARKKVVVAGPGTGKTYLFKKVLVDKQSSLTLTFVNALVEDLSLDLYGMSEVRTLHSFARSLLARLGKKQAINIFPKLSGLIRSDLALLAAQDVDFDRVFYSRDDDNEHIEFYKRRTKYYDDSYGYSDIVFAAVKFLEEHPETIPSYEQIVVDEFQDFNQLEVSLIDLLSQRSPILLAGDDDQALYEFKSASAKHIRDRHDGHDSEYERFNLPLCSRCTRVVVDAANDVVAAAMKNNLLTGRIAKPYQYFDDEEKDKESLRFSSISYAQKFAAQIPWFIGSQLAEVAASIKGTFSVLIISPTKVQSRTVAKALKRKGFRNVEFVEKDEERDPTLLDGLRVLLKDEKSNLGWRIAADFLMKRPDFKATLERSNREDAPPFCDLVSSECKKHAKRMLAVLRKVRDDKPIGEDDIGLLEEIGIEPHKMTLDVLSDELNIGNQSVGNPGLRKLSIRATTIQGSKGLSADVVFITHFDDLYFLSRPGTSDKDVCSFLVALTRARKKVFLISSQRKEPLFLKWISGDRISFA